MSSTEQRYPVYDRYLLRLIVVTPCPAFPGGANLLAVAQLHPLLPVRCLFNLLLFFLFPSVFRVSIAWLALSTASNAGTLSPVISSLPMRLPQLSSASSRLLPLHTAGNLLAYPTSHGAAPSCISCYT